jgi:hypothetical protein
MDRRGAASAGQVLRSLNSYLLPNKDRKIAILFANSH